MQNKTSFPLPSFVNEGVSASASKQAKRRKRRCGAGAQVIKKRRGGRERQQRLGMWAQSRRAFLVHWDGATEIVKHYCEAKAF